MYTKEEYGKKLQRVRHIINKVDPVGLIAGGAPDDEYEVEIQQIMRGLMNTKDKQDISNLTKKIF